VARTSRQQRRQRRGVAAGTPPLQPARPQKVAAEARETALDTTEPRAERPTEASSRGFPGVRFFQEAVAELKKVEWPTQQKVVSGTAVVIVACLLVGVYLYANDRIWSYLVQHVLLR
jgi:preprotein translocase subunit SecE